MTTLPMAGGSALARATARVAARIRMAAPADIPALMRMKRELAVLEGTEAVVLANAGDWLRDGFGPQARFFSLVAEQDGISLGMLTCSERRFTGWVGATYVVQDLYVDPAHRNCGIGRALLAAVTAQAHARQVPLIELIVRADNPARRFYERLGLQPVTNCLPYVLVGPALTELAGSAADWLAALL